MFEWRWIMVDETEGEGDNEGGTKPAPPKGIARNGPRATDRLAFEVENLIAGSPRIGDTLPASNSLENFFLGDALRQASRIQREIDLITSPHMDLAQTLRNIRGDSIDAILRAQEDMMDSVRAPIAELLRQQEDYAAGPMAQLMAEVARLRTFDLSELMPEPLDISALIGGSFGSAAIIAEIQSIGMGVSFGLSFDAVFASALREDVGDWRATIQWPDNLGASTEIREAFYVERGLTLDVTDLPSSTLESIFGLTDPEPENDEEPLTFVIAGNGDQRATQGFQSLRKLEVQMRNWIDTLMRKEFGDGWANSRVAPKVRDAWREKQEKAAKKGLDKGRLIDFADFMDYQHVICMDGNWGRVFAHVFERPENVRESFQRLHPSRLAVMHGRNISTTDLFYLIVEVGRLRSCLERIAGNA